MEPDDDLVEAFIKEHPHGGTLDEIAEMLGVTTRQRAMQIVTVAVEKAAAYLQRRGISHSDLSLD